MSVIRSFIAIDLSPDIRKSLDRVSTQLRHYLPEAPVRWVPTANIHLTLKFLGNVSLANLGVLKELIQNEAARLTPFEISVGEVGAFPSIRRVRVVIVQVQAPAQLSSLQRGLEEQTRRLGYEPETRPFTPHLTLGRVNRNASLAQVEQVGQALESMKVGFLGAMKVESVNLYRSDLHPTGAVYTLLHKASFAQEA
jgi:2'-5' RNA ligase